MLRERWLIINSKRRCDIGHLNDTVLYGWWSTHGPATTTDKCSQFTVAVHMCRDDKMIVPLNDEYKIDALSLPQSTKTPHWLFGSMTMTDCGMKEAVLCYVAFCYFSNARNGRIIEVTEIWSVLFNSGPFRLMHVKWMCAGCGWRLSCSRTSSHGKCMDRLLSHSFMCMLSGLFWSRISKLQIGRVDDSPSASWTLNEPRTAFCALPLLRFFMTNGIQNLEMLMARWFGKKTWNDQGLQRITCKISPTKITVTS